MGCFFHPESESVVTCGRCGVAMCRECESNAFFRLDQGKGQALCNRCSLAEEQSIVSELKSWLSKRLAKLIIVAILVCIGLFCFVAKNTDGLIFTIPCWIIAGFISLIGEKKQSSSLKSEVEDAIYEHEHPFLSFVVKLIGYGIFAPIFLLVGFFAYLRSKSTYKKELKALDMIQASLENQ